MPYRYSARDSHTTFRATATGHGHGLITTATTSTTLLLGLSLGWSGTRRTTLTAHSEQPSASMPYRYSPRDSRSTFRTPATDHGHGLITTATTITTSTTLLLGLSLDWSDARRTTPTTHSEQPS